MMCERCHTREASIHYFESVNGKSTSQNLCELCAVDTNLAEKPKSIVRPEDFKVPDGIDARPDGSIRPFYKKDKPDV